MAKIKLTALANRGVDLLESLLAALDTPRGAELLTNIEAVRDAARDKAQERCAPTDEKVVRHRKIGRHEFRWRGREYEAIFYGVTPWVSLAWLDREWDGRGHPTKVWIANSIAGFKARGTLAEVRSAVEREVDELICR